MYRSLEMATRRSVRKFLYLSFFILVSTFLILILFNPVKTRSEPAIKESLYLIQLTKDASLDANGSWSPDGKEIVFQTRRQGEKEKGKSLDEDDEEDSKKKEKEKKKGEEKKKKDKDKEKKEEREEARDRDIWIINGDGSNPRQLTKRPEDEYQPVFSPDGKKILFVSEERGTRDIWVMDRDGSNKTRLTKDKGIEQHPAWSPDGKKIVYSALPREADNFDLWVMDADGSTKLQLTKTPGNEITPSWHPYGHLIAFSSDEGENLDIYVMDLDGKNRMKLIDTARHEFQPTWSSDGSKIAYSAWNSEESLDRSNIWIANADGSQQTQLTTVPPNLHPVWHPDGTKILFHSKRSKNWDLWLLQVPEELLKTGPVAQLDLLQGTPEKDLLRLKDGNILPGEFLNSSISFTSPYFTLDLDPRKLTSLEFEEELGDMAKVVTSYGDRLSGLITEKSFNFKIESGEVKEFRKETTSSIGLRVIATDLSKSRFRDELILRNGDLLLGKVLNERFMIDLNTRVVEIPKKDITKIDFIEPHRGQIILTKQDGEVIHGTLIVEDIKIQMDFGPTVNIFRDKIKFISLVRSL